MYAAVGMIRRCCPWDAEGWGVSLKEFFPLQITGRDGTADMQWQKEPTGDSGQVNLEKNEADVIASGPPGNLLLQYVALRPVRQSSFPHQVKRKTHPAPSFRFRFGPPCRMAVATDMLLLHAPANCIRRRLGEGSLWRIRAAAWTASSARSSAKVR